MKSTAKYLFLLCLMHAGLKSNAQNEQDVLRYGQTPIGGSARYIGMGGAFNSLGGDVSALSSNPAGTAVFLSNEFVIGLGVNLNSTTGSFLNRATGNLETRIVVPTFGIIANRNIENSKWKAINFGYTYNRLADFYNKVSFRGNDIQSGLVNGLVSSANGYLPDSLDPWSTGLAFNNYLIDTVPGSNGLLYSSGMTAGDRKKSYTTTNTGKMGDNLFTVGANYNNKLYIGAAVSIIGVSFNYAEVDREEKATNDSLVSSFIYKETLNAQGAGYNAKLGVIYRVADNLRFGASYQTPTTFRMVEEFYTSLSTQLYDETDERYAESPVAQSNYNIIVPARIGFGASYLFGKKGLISFDYNFTDYSKAKFKNQLYSSSPDDNQIDFSFANQMLNRYLGPAQQIKFGGEYKIKNYTLRAGYGYADSGIKKTFRIAETAQQTISFGAGVTIENMTIDFGVANTRFTKDYFIYNEAASIKYGLTSANFTVIFRY